MKRSNWLLVSCICYALLGCASVKTTHNTLPQTTTGTPKVTTPKKDPIAVSVYPVGKKLATPYTVLGEAKVSNYNASGIKRQDAVIHDAMRTMAASMGGDAVIDIKRTGKAVIGKVVIWQSKVFV
ncbi:MAG TPA: hypothetical protein VLJ15_04540 [Gammaproteobacteria bacterium]|nr:hypothetical protein [Gammaproteobacteria bacterium]